MKLYTVFSLCFILPSIMCMTEEMKQMAAALHKTCIDEIGLDQAVLDKVNSEKVLPDDDKLKCYLKCLMSEVGVMDDHGMIDPEAFIAMLPEEYQEKFGSPLRNCGTKVGANPCENAWLTHQCYLESAPEAYHII